MLLTDFGGLWRPVDTMADLIMLIMLILHCILQLDGIRPGRDIRDPCLAERPTSGRAIDNKLLLVSYAVFAD